MTGPIGWSGLNVSSGLVWTLLRARLRIRPKHHGLYSAGRVSVISCVRAEFSYGLLVVHPLSCCALWHDGLSQPRDENLTVPRSRLQNCLGNLPAIEQWRQTLGLTPRLQLNHSNAVWRRFQAAQSTVGKGNDAKPGVHQRNMRLKSELAG